MADRPTAVKKIMLDDYQILHEFLKNKELRRELKEKVDYIWRGQGTNPPIACPLKIGRADANMCRSFSNAICLQGETHFCKEKKTTPFVIGIGRLFVKGCTILRAFLTEELIPEDKHELKALERLVTYLTQPGSKALFEETNDEKKIERNWCLKMAQHLFSQLSSKEYTIDNKYEEGSTKVCPCEAKEVLSGKFGDTSFGCKTLWHGSSDLLFGMPLQFVSHDQFSDSGSESEGSVTEDTSSVDIEAKGGDVFSLKDKCQMRAQVIGFSFYIHKIEREMNEEKAKYFLIPHIGFSKEKICYRFYDSVNDVLLEMNPLDLFQFEGKLSPYVILLTWLVLNYKVLSEETPACLFDYKSGFHDMFRSMLGKYKEEIEHPCHIKSSLQKEGSLPFKVEVESQDICDYEEEKKRFKLKKI